MPRRGSPGCRRFAGLALIEDPLVKSSGSSFRAVIKILENYPLAPLTTFQIGGPARYFLRASTVDDVTEGLEFAKANELDVFILGGGSNLLVSDDGIDALVIRVAIGGVKVGRNSGGRTEVVAGAGVNWDELVKRCIVKGLAGFECLSGIPGLAGGTPIQNVGAYGQEVSETVLRVQCLDRTNGNIVDLTNAQCEFSYRSSIFNTDQKGRYIVLGVTYSLETDGEPKVVYKDLLEYFADHKPTLPEVREAVLAVRRSKSMVIDPRDQNSRSAGSFFKNPLVDRSDFESLLTKFSRIPSYDFGDKIKIPAAWLIENAGFHKGYALGDVGISERHTLAIINRGGGTAAEVIALKTEIEKAVLRKFGINLVPEPIFAGFRGGE